jgi:hypothetical protein
MIVTCLETEEPEGRRSHAWTATGLDVVDGVLCSTRRCVWCQIEQAKPYGPRRSTWRNR